MWYRAITVQGNSPPDRPPRTNNNKNKTKNKQKQKRKRLDFTATSCTRFRRNLSWTAQTQIHVHRNIMCHKLYTINQPLALPTSPPTITLILLWILLKNFTLSLYGYNKCLSLSICLRILVHQRNACLLLFLFLFCFFDSVYLFFFLFLIYHLHDIQRCFTLLSEFKHS